MLQCTYAFKLLKEEAPDDGSSESKYAAVWEMTLKCCFVRHAFFRLFMINLLKPSG
jgi:hypothetical protein